MWPSPVMGLNVDVSVRKTHGQLSKISRQPVLCWGIVDPHPDCGRGFLLSCPRVFLTLYMIACNRLLPACARGFLSMSRADALRFFCHWWMYLLSWPKQYKLGLGLQYIFIVKKFSSGCISTENFMLGNEYLLNKLDGNKVNWTEH